MDQPEGRMLAAAADQSRTITTMNLTIYCPGRVVGGTNTLFARVAEHWQRATASSPTVIDFEDGVVASYLQDRSVPFHLAPHHKGLAHRIPANHILLMSLLPARRLGYSVLPDPETKLLLWLTHPQDGFKWLPAYRPCLKYSDSAKRLYARIVHPKYHGQLAAAFDLAAEKGGLVSMDQDCNASLLAQYGLARTPAIIPVFTEAPAGRVLRNETTRLRICWIGRTTDFKLQPLLALIALVDQSSEQLQLDIIGAGAELDIVRHKAEDSRNSKVRILGEMRPKDLENHLLEHVDVAVGHGLSILEAAKHKIPSLLIDGFYFNPPIPAVRFRWLHETPAGYVGSILRTVADFKGKPFSQAISEVTSDDQLGYLAYERWQGFHSPQAVVPKLIEATNNTELAYKDLVEAGIHRFDPIGQALFSARLWATKNKY